jgi:iron(III) transport system substrate-binding protein
MKFPSHLVLSVALAIGVSLSAAVQAAEITVYSAGPDGLATGLATAFKKETGIDVKMFQATTGKIMARMEAEKANPQVDVLISASWTSAVDLKAKGDLMAYTSSNAAKIPPALKDSHYVAQGAAAIALVWNNKSGKPKPTDWFDLAAPAYKDAVAMPDPAASGSAYGLIEGLIAARGDAAWSLFEKLRANGMIVPGANAEALNPVLQGARAAVFGAVDYIALGAKKKGETIDVIYPSTGTIVEARPMMIFKWSKNPDGAKKFIDFVLSEAGQKLVADTLMLPARTDIKAQRAGWDEIKLLPETESSAPQRAATLARFKKVMGM